MGREKCSSRRCLSSRLVTPFIPQQRIESNSADDTRFILKLSQRGSSSCTVRGCTHLYITERVRMRIGTKAATCPSCFGIGSTFEQHRPAMFSAPIWGFVGPVTAAQQPLVIIVDNAPTCHLQVVKIWEMSSLIPDTPSSLFQEPTAMYTSTRPPFYRGVVPGVSGYTCACVLPSMRIRCWHRCDLCLLTRGKGQKRAYPSSNYEESELALDSPFMVFRTSPLAFATACPPPPAAYPPSPNDVLGRGWGDPHAFKMTWACSDSNAERGNQPACPSVQTRVELLTDEAAHKAPSSLTEQGPR